MKISPSLPPELLVFLKSQKNVQKIQVPAGVSICQSGDLCESLVIILTGQAKVYRPAANGRSLTLYYVSDNESCILTASCILNAMPFPAYAESMSEIEGLSIPSDKVKKWLHSEPLWQQYIMSLLSQRMVGLIELVNALAFQGLNERLESWLLTQMKDIDELKVTHQFIAEELASSREVISRLLKELEQDNLIQLGRGSIKILNREALRSEIQ